MTLLATGMLAPLQGTTSSYLVTVVINRQFMLAI